MPKQPFIDWQETMRTNRQPLYKGPAQMHWRGGADEPFDEVAQKLWEQYGDGRARPTKDLPGEARKAVFSYFYDEGLTDASREEIDAEWLWGYFEVPTSVFLEAYMELAELREFDWENWEEYHEWYKAPRRSEPGGLNLEERPGRWPVILGGDELVWDGHHRLHTYVARGDKTIPALIELDEEKSAVEEPTVRRASRRHLGNSYEDVGFSESGRWGNAGSGILFTTGDKILLLQRSWEVEEPHTWGIPGGAIPQTRGGEFMDAYESAKKETREEIGSLPPHHCIDEYVYEEEGFQYTTFICEVSEKDAEAFYPRFNWENDDYAWVSLDELGDYDLHFGVLELLEHVNPFF